MTVVAALATVFAVITTPPPRIPLALRIVLFVLAMGLSIAVAVGCRTWLTRSTGCGPRTGSCGTTAWPS
ncbi:hypothetical protein ACFQX7_37085 [Luedemannella flava]